MRNQVGKELAINKIFILLPLALIFLTSGALANGLAVVGLNDTILQVNKTIGQAQTVQLQIENQEPFTFFNISFLNNPYIEMTSISQLGSGQTVTFDANIIGTESFNGEVRIKGLYQANVGSGDPETEDIFISYNSGTDTYSIDRCSVSIRKGDSIRWHNNAGNTVRLIRAPDDTPISGGEIPNGGEITLDFNSEEVITYYVAIASFPITPNCQINVLGDTGLVNDPNLDAVFTLDLKVKAQPTTISVNTPITAYTISHSSSQEGAIFITNTGSQPVVGLSLESDSGWFSFSPNNFNINIGETRVVTYQIAPLISSTNETNQTYSKNVEIKGNFDTQTQSFTITVPYASVIQNNGNFTSGRSIIDVLQEYCLDNPGEVFCNNGTGLGNGAVNDPEFNISIKNSQFLDLARSIVGFKDEFTTALNFIKDNDAQESIWQNETNQRLAVLEEGFLENNERGESNKALLFSIVVGILMVIAISASGWVIWKKRTENIRRETEGWTER